MQATPASHLENIFQIEATAYKTILQAAFECKPLGFLPGTDVIPKSVNIHIYMLFL